MLVRFFFSAVDPADRDDFARIFFEDVKPAFEVQQGCLDVELLVSPEENVGGLLEGALVSRWRTHADVERALKSRELAESLVRVRQLLRVEPVIHTYVAAAPE